MNELSLFSGIGGGLLGTKLLGFNHIGYVEINDYCQQVLAQRIKDGILDKAPIFTDVREFIQSGAARQYRGFADVVTAGFPCQPFSVAGKQAGENDPRNMWPETLAILLEVRPQYALLENVPGLLSHEYARRIFGDLAESGFDVRWRVLSAAEMGAPHKRDRVWIVAHNNSDQLRQQQISERRSSGQAKFAEDGEKQPMGNAKRKRRCSRDTSRENAEDAGERSESKRKNTGRMGWWSVEPGMGRVANGVPYRVDRLAAIGNGQIPLVAATAWRILAEG